MFDQTTGSSATGGHNCHRCGKPSGGSYLGSEPTCVWCINKLVNNIGHYSLTPNTTFNIASVVNTEALIIKVRYLVDGLEPLQTIGQGDWVDLRASEDTNLLAGEYKLIPLGVAIELPKGYEAIFAPRSSTFKTWGVLQTNSIGVIDESYCGNDDMWKMAVYATRDTVIHKNDRICQFRIIMHQPALTFQTVDFLEGKSRGGFGSTGVK